MLGRIRLSHSIRTSCSIAFEPPNFPAFQGLGQGLHYPSLQSRNGHRVLSLALGAVIRGSTIKTHAKSFALMVPVSPCFAAAGHLPARANIAALKLPDVNRWVPLVLTVSL